MAHVSTDGLLHKAKRAVIFQTIRRNKGATVDAISSLLGCSPRLLQSFLEAEGFTCCDEIEGAYPGDLDSLKEISDVGLEDGRVAKLEEALEYVTKCYEKLLKAQVQYAKDLALLEGYRHRIKMMRRQLENALSRKCETCERKLGAGKADPTPSEIEEQCKQIRAEAEARYARGIGHSPGNVRHDAAGIPTNGYGQSGHKVYKLRFDK